MNLVSRLILLTSGILVSYALANPNITIQRTVHQPLNTNVEYSVVSHGSKETKIALICAPKIIGKYAQSTYDVALATLLGKHQDLFSLKRFNMPDESAESLAQAIQQARQEGFSAILAPLTLAGAQRLSTLESGIDVFIPTVHKRDVPNAPDNFTFGAIDYVRQIEALVPYMSSGIAIFYDDSNVGMQLKKETEALFMESNKAKKSIASYRVDAQGDNIISYLSKPSSFSKKSVILHIPVVKSAILTAHLTFTGIKNRNILSTQINVDPTLLTLTQYIDRKNMLLANSIVEHSADIDGSNALLNNDITFDWINYTTSVGSDYLIAALSDSPRNYSLRIVDGQVIYPVEILKAEAFGFEPIISE